MASSFPDEIAAASDSDVSSKSGYGSMSDITTESLTSSIYEYRYQNGRRYHAYKEGRYLLPNDETEQDRLDIIHHIFLLLLDDQLLLAPIGPNPQKILDVGTGTGIWAIDAGEKYPSAEVIGTDLSPIQPTWVPPNVQFQVDDAESEWTFSKDSFDLIHIRHLIGSIVDWSMLFKEAYKHCKPGGWIDVTEYEGDLFCDDGSLPDHLELRKYYKLLNKALHLTGRSMEVSAKLQSPLEDAGFTNVHYQVAKIPIGPWAADSKQKELGAYALLSLETGFEAFGLKLFTDVLKMDVGDAKYLISEAFRQIKSRKVHSYGMHHFYYGQKPLEGVDD